MYSCGDDNSIDRVNARPYVFEMYPNDQSTWIDMGKLCQRSCCQTSRAVTVLSNQKVFVSHVEWLFLIWKVPALSQY